MNPLTGRAIKEGGPTYRQFETGCSQHDNAQNQLARMAASYHDTKYREFIALLNDPNVKLDFKYESQEGQYLPHIIAKKSAITSSLFFEKFDEAARTRLTPEEYKAVYMATTTGNETLLDILIARSHKWILNWMAKNLDVQLLAELKVTRKPNVIAYLMEKLMYDVARVMSERKVPYPKAHYNHATLWAGARGQGECFKSFVLHNGADPNYREGIYGSTALLYAIHHNHALGQSLTDFFQHGASMYISSIVQMNNGRNKNFNIYTNVGYNDIEAFNNELIKDLQVMETKHVETTSEDFFNVAQQGINRILGGYSPQRDIVARTADMVAQKAYLYKGVVFDEKSMPITLSEKTKQIQGTPFEAWYSEDTLAKLKVRIIPVGEYLNEASTRKRRTIYDIYLYHEGLNQYVGLIGNFIKSLPADKRNVPELTDHAVLEKALQRLHDKRQLLLPMFPYQSRLHLFMFDERIVDEVKLQRPMANKNPHLNADSKAYMDLLLSVQAAINKKTRFIPHYTTDVVTKAYSTNFPRLMQERAQRYKEPEIAQEIAKALLKEKSSSSSPLPAQDLRDTIIQRLTEHRDQVDGSTVFKKVAYNKVINQIQSMQTPIRTRDDLKDVKGIGEKMNTILSTVFEEAPSRNSRKVSAQKKIAKFVKKRVSSLTKYFEDSIRYMDKLPMDKRRTIYRALNGQIMQGPYSPIKRVDGLLYARADNGEDLLTMLEVVARAPRLPIRYSLYRGMYVNPPPTVGTSAIYQEIPFSTTFLSMYALGWVLAKKNTNCCLFELQCHKGTSGLFLSKLPWMDPWTSANSAIFHRIAPDNVRNKFHIKVNSQNEFLMFPYKLVVVGSRTKNFKSLLDEQIEKVDSHYEFDASQRKLTSLFENNEDLLNKDITIYTLELQPISLYMVELKSISPNYKHNFQPSRLMSNASQRQLNDIHEYTHMFFSPEEMAPGVVQSIESELRASNGPAIVKLVEKGKYVGPKTFD
jgi:predicted flap endonuclease-1-like 5' DNA nuclease